MGRGTVNSPATRQLCAPTKPLAWVIRTPDLPERRSASLSASEFWRWIDGNALADGLELFDHDNQGASAVARMGALIARRAARSRDRDYGGMTMWQALIPAVVS